MFLNVFKSVKSFGCHFFKLLTDYTPCSRIFIVDFEQVNTHWVYSDFCICIRQIHEPCHIKMENFTIILNNFQAFAIVSKRSILNVVGFLDPPLHCNKFAAKAVGWFKPKKDVYVYLHILVESI